MEAVHAATVGVTLDHHRAHVVVEDLDGHATERQQRVLVASDQGLDAFVVAELHIGRAAPSERRDEQLELPVPASHRCPVGLHLMARLGLEAHYRLCRRRWQEAAHELLQPRLAAVVAARLDLAVEHHGGDSVGSGRLHPFDDVVLVRVELLGRFRPRLARRCGLALPQVTPNRVARPARCTREFTNARAMPPQDVQLHPILRRQHRPLHPGGTTEHGGSDSSCRPGQFPTADDTAKCRS